MSTAPPLLIAAVLHLECRAGGVLPTANGRAAHAALLGAVERHDPHLSEWFHRPRPLQPLTLSPLLTSARRRAAEVQIARGEICRLRVTALAMPVVSLLLAWRQRPPSSLQIDWMPFRVAGLTIDPTVDPDTGACTFSALDAAHQSAPTRGRLRIVTPATFRRPDGNLPLPDPEHLFVGLAAAWARARSGCFEGPAPDAPPPRARLCRHQIRTEFCDFGGGRRQVGFTGAAEFEPPHDALPEDARALSRLIRFAFFAGIGARTTWGMGQARPANLPELAAI